MLKLIQSEFFKLRRRKLVWVMLTAALFMPFLAFLYFRYMGETGVDPVQFYKWSAFGYTTFLILPVVLGILCTMLMYEENQYGMTDQLLLVPVSRMGYFFSKFFVVLIYSICFMLITAVSSVMFSVFPGYVAFEWESVLYLLKKCFEISALAAFAMMPVLSVAASQKGYVLPVCMTLVYTFLGFMLITVNMYLHPLSSMSVIVMRNRDIPGIVFAQAVNIPFAFLCIGIWDISAVILAFITLRRR